MRYMKLSEGGAKKKRKAPSNNRHFLMMTHAQNWGMGYTDYLLVPYIWNLQTDEMMMNKKRYMQNISDSSLLCPFTSLHIQCPLMQTHYSCLASITRFKEWHRLEAGFCVEDLLSIKIRGFQSIDKLHAADLACMIASNDLSNVCI